MSKLIEMNRWLESEHIIKAVSEKGEAEINWQELAEVYADILDELGNELWQLLHPGEPNSWTMPAQIVAEIKERLNGD